jgi:hypothetical protein
MAAFLAAMYFGLDVSVGSMGEIASHWSLVIGHWSLVIGHWSLVSGQWSVVSGQWSVVSGRRGEESLVNDK